MVERLGRQIVPLVGEQIGEIVQTLKAVRIFRSSCPAHRFPGAACIRFCLREVSPGLEDQSQVVEACQCMRMVRSQSSLPGFQHLLMESLSLEILAAIVEQIRQIVHRGQSVDMVGTERSLTLGLGNCETVLQQLCTLLCLAALAPHAPSIRRFEKQPVAEERPAASRTRKSGRRKRRESAEQEPTVAIMTGRFPLMGSKSFQII